MVDRRPVPKEAPRREGTPNSTGSANGTPAELWTLALVVGSILAAIALPWPTLVLAALTSTLAIAVLLRRRPRSVSGVLRRVPEDDRSRNIRAAALDLVVAAGLGVVAAWSLNASAERRAEALAEEERARATRAEEERARAEAEQAAEALAAQRLAALRTEAPGHVAQARDLAAKGRELRERGATKEAQGMLERAVAEARPYTEVSQEAVKLAAALDGEVAEIRDRVTADEIVASVRLSLTQARFAIKKRLYRVAAEQLDQATERLDDAPSRYAAEPPLSALQEDVAALLAEIKPEVEREEAREIAIAIDLGNALHKAELAGKLDPESEGAITRRVAKKHGITAKAVDGIWLRRMSDPRVTSKLGGSGEQTSAPAAEAPGATEVASELGLRTRARSQISAIATAYGVSARTVADKAAKTSELCLGGMEAVAEKPALAVAKVEGALEYGAGIAADADKRRRVDIDDLFVTYITLGCPGPSR